MVGSVTLWEGSHGAPFVGPVVRPSGSSLPPASQCPPPRLLRKPVSLPFPIGRSPLLLRGVPSRGGWPSRGSRSVPPPLPFVRREGGVLRGFRLLGTGLPVVQFIEFLFVSILTISDNLSSFSSFNHSLPGKKFLGCVFSFALSFSPVSASGTPV